MSRRSRERAGLEPEGGLTVEKLGMVAQFVLGQLHEQPFIAIQVGFDCSPG